MDILPEGAVILHPRGESRNFASAVTVIATPVFTIVAVTALRLGIGANATVFSVGNHLVMKPLPAHDPQSLTRITKISKKRRYRINIVTTIATIHPAIASAA